MHFQRFLMRNRHGSMWYSRVYVPRHLQCLLHGRKELRKSTKCTDKRQAGRVALRYWAECQSLFDQLEYDVAKKKKSGSFQIGYATIPLSWRH